MVKALCAVADSSEDIELSTTTDILVRAGVEVVIASVMPQKEVRLARGLKLTADTLITEVNPAEFDLVFCPGGMPGAEHFQKSAALNKFVLEMKRTGKFYSAICATPNVMFASNSEIMEGVTTITCYPSMQPQLQQKCPSVKVSTERVVVDGKCITSQGPGTTMAFALKLVEVIVGAEKATSIAKDLLYSA
jgi:4-methyl-5(b-hydroxyethyl)-thiazole monophosphate biosynthesis